MTNQNQMVKDLLLWWQNSNPDLTTTAIISGSNKTLLHLATEKGYVPIVKELIAMGADVNSQDDNKLSPLHVASQEKHNEVMKLLLEMGADPNVSDTENGTPLHDACENGSVEGAKILIDKGAKIKVYNRVGLTPFHLALQNDDVDVCEFLLQKVSKLVEQPTINKTGNYPMHTACENGNADMVKLLIRKGSGLTMFNNLGVSPIEVAIRSGRSEIVNLILQKNPRIIKNKNAFGLSLLHTAVLCREIDILKELLNGGTLCVNAQTFQMKSTPLHSACRESNGSKEIVKLLLEKDAPPYILDKNGDTPLHLAIMAKNTEIVETIVQSRQCDLFTLNIKNKKGKTAFDLAFEDNQFHVAKIIHKEIQNKVDKNEENRVRKTEKDNECLICFQPKNGIFALQPCGHARTCENCSKKIIERSSPCPFCRKEAKNYQKIFL